MRRRIAIAAAGLIAEGMTDYRAAKMKAARRLNCDMAEALPDNREIDVAVREHMAIFQGNSQPQELFELREIAIKVMHRLEQFSPRLLGPVLTGTANRFSNIELEVLTEDEKTFTLFLLNENIAYEVSVRPNGKLRKQTRVYGFLIDEAPISVAVFVSAAERAQQRAYSGIDGERADLIAVDRLLMATTAHKRTAD
ncbi:MAG TPA: nucleotidyltransferase [Usitatibacteraceae bacterium]